MYYVKVWIYVESKVEGQHECLVIHPKMTVMEATTQVWRQLNTDYKKDHILHEFILEDGLERPMDHNEFIMDCILKWGNWPEEDRKHSYLILKAIKEEFGQSLKCVGRKSSNSFECEVNYSPNTGKRIDKAIKEIATRRNKPNYLKCKIELQCDEIVCSKKATHKSLWTLSALESSTLDAINRKSFSVSMKDLSKGNLFKDSIQSPPSQEPEYVYERLTKWHLSDIFWYYGVESKRNSPSQYNITIINRKAEVLRSRTEPYFGESISFQNRETWIDFVAALLQFEINKDRGPPPGIPSGKKPPKEALSVISDVEEDSCEEVFEDCQDFEDQSIELREKDYCDGHSQSSSEDDHRTTVKFNIGRLVGSMAIGNQKRHSLKELLTSLSEEKEHIEDRMKSGIFLKPNTCRYKERSCSF